MASYYGAKYFSDQPVPTCSDAGVVRSWLDTVTITTALTTSDTCYIARMPANHRVIRLDLYASDMDSGTTITWTVGTTADADHFALAEATLGRTAITVSLPATGVATSNVPGWFATATPTANYDVVAILAAGPATTTGTLAARVWYVVDAAYSDPTSSPAAVTGTQ